MTLYDYPRSGHAHRIRLFLSIIGEPYESVNIDMQKGEHKDPEYRKLSPLGQVPTFVDGDVIITDSTAALVYLAIKHGDERWLPRDAEGAARVQRGLSTASGEVYRGPVPVPLRARVSPAAKLRLVLGGKELERARHRRRGFSVLGERPDAVTHAPPPRPPPPP